MWWSRRLFFALPIILGACGFTPVYGPASGGNDILGRVAFQEPTTRDHFVLVKELEQRLGRATNADYRIDYSSIVTSEALAVSVTGAQTRYNLIGVLTFSIVDTGTGQILLSDQIEDFASYSAAGTTVALFAAEQDARERLMISIANSVASRLLATDLP